MSRPLTKAEKEWIRSLVSSAVDRLGAMAAESTKKMAESIKAKLKS